MTSVARNHSLVTDGVTQSNVPYRTRVDGHDSAQGGCPETMVPVFGLRGGCRQVLLGEEIRNWRELSDQERSGNQGGFSKMLSRTPPRIWCHFDPNSDTPENVKILSNSDMSEFDSRIVKFALSGTGSNPRVKTVFSPIRHTYFLAVFLPT